MTKSREPQELAGPPKSGKSIQCHSDTLSIECFQTDFVVTNQLRSTDAKEEVGQKEKRQATANLEIVVADRDIKFPQQVIPGGGAMIWRINVAYMPVSHV